MHQTAFGTTRLGAGRFSMPAVPAAMIYSCVISFTTMPAMLGARIDVQNRIVGCKSPRIRRRRGLVKYQLGILTLGLLFHDGLFHGGCAAHRTWVYPRGRRR